MRNEVDRFNDAVEEIRASKAYQKQTSHTAVLAGDVFWNFRAIFYGSEELLGQMEDEDGDGDIGTYESLNLSAISAGTDSSAVAAPTPDMYLLCQEEDW